MNEAISLVITEVTLVSRPGADKVASHMKYGERIILEQVTAGAKALRQDRLLSEGHLGQCSLSSVSDGRTVEEMGQRGNGVASGGVPKWRRAL